jgi:ketosteroid isomerase-like protein
MKLLITSIILLFAAGACSTQVDQDKVKESIQATNNLFMESIKGKNPEAVANLYSEDCQLLAPNMPALNGRAAVKGYMEHGINSGISAIKLTTLEVNAGSDFAMEQGTYEIFVMDTLKVDAGKYIVEWKKNGDQWQLHRDIMNSDWPAPRTVAKAGEQVWVITYYVNKGKAADFESFIKNELFAALDKTDMTQAQSIAQTRLLSGQADKTGITKYVFIMDPVVKEFHYDMEKILIQKHGEDIGKEKFKQFNSLLSKAYEFTAVTQTDI